ncbi:hypothetical protein M427DRAFT_39730 [Gonapodya prolifera JEL478]|uniref:Uncharacterized protein n=1 Tax=Gonapodya prolifera (strain JEL478) TaxID=1344416 RepID=A0A138ZWY2_GONPJ|nr:hypothetical protein M427DRAFT_39730 [Gonapodya prolifera JEL478]|eukprot:KXS09006.1 hypothetical protein M427DRAFT_39730 [Gonapodya prolifera JEL478]
MSSSSITSIIAKWRLQGTFTIPMNQIDLKAFTPIRERYKPGVLEIIMVILFRIGEDRYGIVDGNHRLVALYRLKDEGKDYETLPGLLDGTLTVNAIILWDDTPEYVRSDIGSMVNFTGETRVPMNPFDTFMAVRRSLTYGTTNGTQRQVRDVVKDFEGTSHVKQIGNWIMVAKSYTAVPIFEAILREDAISNMPNFHLPITTLYAEGGVKKYLVDKDPELALKEVRDMAQLWGERYSPWIKGYLQLSDNDRWTNEKKREARVLILSGTFKDTSTRAHVLEQCKERLRIISKKGKEKAPSKEVPAPTTPIPRITTQAGEPSGAVGLVDIPDKQPPEELLPTPRAKEGPPTTPQSKRPTKLEDTLNKFSADKGQTANLIVLDFPSLDQADHVVPSGRLQDIALNKVLHPDGILMEYGSTCRDYTDFGASSISTIHVAFHANVSRTKKVLNNKATIFGAKNVVAHYIVASRSVQAVNWSIGTNWHLPEQDVVTYKAQQEGRKAVKNVPFFSAQVPSALWMEVLTLLTNPGNHVVIPSVGTGSVATACALLGRECTGWVFDDHFHSRLDIHHMELEAQTNKDARKVFERLISDRDFFRYATASFSAEVAATPASKVQLLAENVDDEDDKELIKYPYTAPDRPSSSSVPRNSQGVPLDVAQFISDQAAVASRDEDDEGEDNRKDPGTPPPGDTTESEPEVEEAAAEPLNLKSILLQKGPVNQHPLNLYKGGGEGGARGAVVHLGSDSICIMLST